MGTRRPPRRIGIFDPVPAYRDGLGAALTAAGYRVDTAPDPHRWARLPGARIALVTLREPAHDQLLIDLINQRPDLTVVALLPEPNIDSHIRAVRLGATTAAPWDADPDHLVAVLDAISTRHTLVPLELHHVLVATAPTAAPTSLTPLERSWLADLARGHTVRALAEKHHRSERGMHRSLSAVYRKLGATNRSEALTRAAQLGLL